MHHFLALLPDVVVEKGCSPLEAFSLWEMLAGTPHNRMARVLIIDDDPAMVQVISDICTEAGHTAIAYSSGQRALAMMHGHAPQLIITDIRMDAVGGMDVLRAAKTLLPGVPVIMVTANKQLAMAIDAMRAGSFDYILKPFKVDDLQAAIQRALDESFEPAAAAHSASSAVREHLRFENIIGRSARIQAVFDLVEKVANTDSTILIMGESGTGKELVARALHFKSERKARPFVAINCSALPENLLESELFGHKKGAFTGATQDKVGLFEEAEGGTIFLDEINSMAPLLQTKLLRVLQERIVRRVGDNRNIPIHVRVLAATNELLQDKIKTGAFRQDLYYRLAVIPVEMPSLRDRQDDIPLLVEHFLRKHSRTGPDVPAVRIEESATRALCAYQWPGNVRELENALERACALCDHGVVQLKDLPPHVLEPAVYKVGECVGAEHAAALVPLPIGSTLEAFISVLERRFIDETVRFNHGVRERAAHMLGISTATLYRKLDADRKNQLKRPADPQ